MPVISLIPRFLVALLATSTAFAADSFNGEWVTDAAHAPQRPVGLRAAVLRIEAEGAHLVLTESGVDAGGTPYSLKFTADCDGRVNGIVDVPQIDSVQCWRNDTRTLIFKLIREAVPREWRTAEVAKNGQTLRITSTVTDAGGKEIKSAAVFLKK